MPQGFPDTVVIKWQTPGLINPETEARGKQAALDALKAGKEPAEAFAAMVQEMFGFSVSGRGGLVAIINGKQFGPVK